MSFLDKLSEWFHHIIRDDDSATVTVVKGDSLWRIAEHITGDGGNWTAIADLNPGLNKDYVIQPGQVLKIPREWTV